MRQAWLAQVHLEWEERLEVVVGVWLAERLAFLMQVSRLACRMMYLAMYKNGSSSLEMDAIEGC